MAFVATFLVNAALNFALSLILAALLGPDAFGRYAIGISIAIAINTMLFEWLRLSTARFQSSRAQVETPAIRRTIDLAYWISGAGLAALTAAALGVDAGSGLSRPLLAAAAICGFAYGLFEYRMALARALFLERSYVALVLLRGFFGFAISAAVSYATGDPVLALLGSAVAAILPILIVQHRLRAPSGVAAAPFDKAALSSFARYAVPLIAANALYQLMPLFNRGLLAGRGGFVEAGYFALVSELATRLFQNVGAALDIMLFQLAVRTEEQNGRAAAEGRIADNAGIVAAIILPAAVGLWLVWPAFEAVFIPQSFRGHLAGSAPYLIAALAFYALIQFALNPFFQIQRRTGPVVAAALVALAVNVGAVLIWPRLPGAEGFALAQLAGIASGCFVLGGLAVANGARLPTRELFLSALSAGAMALAVGQVADLGPPILTLLAQTTLGAAVYGLCALLVDLCGCRAFLAHLPGRRPAARIR